MYRLLEQRLSRFLGASERDLLNGGKVGIEKETLRVGPDGKIAQTPHPVVIGSPLTNPYITTDYSEALLEFITSPLTDLQQTLAFLCQIHQFVYRNLEDELLWSTSMPCVVEGEQSIPIARYGNSNVGTMKHIYRQGLGHRYGRLMQVIAGVHFNYSFPDAFWPAFQDQEQDARPLQGFISDSYFALMRNLQRCAWIIPYLFGSSPAVCSSFLAGRTTDLANLDDHTYFSPYATSLRMSDIGYTNKNKAGLNVSYNSFDEYIANLTYAISTPFPDYEKIGVVVDGAYRQLNANILQIENEYYSAMRPKQLTRNNERPTLALQRRGVEYLELRALDVGAFDPMGVNEETLRFLEALIALCLFQDSPPIDADERTDIEYNYISAAGRGRDPELRLRRAGRTQPLREWATELCEVMVGFCELLDRGASGKPYSRALAAQRARIEDPELTPSARMFAEMSENEETFFEFALRISQQHHAYFTSLPIDTEKMNFFKQAAEASHQRQREIESGNDISFEEYLRGFFA